MTAPGGPRLIHQALLYGSAEQYLAATVPFVSAGLHNGDAVVAVTADGNAALLREQLGSDATRVSFIDASSWYDSPGRTLAACYQLVDELATKHGLLRVIGEQVWDGRDPLETSEWARYESVVNVALANSPAWIVCGYDQSALPAAILDDARRTHPQLAVGVDTRPNDAYADPETYYAEHNDALPPPPDLGVARLHFFADPAPVRQFVVLHAQRLGIPALRLDDFIVSVNEVATNAIRHGAGHGKASLWATAHRVVCEVSDPGTAREQFQGFVRGDVQADHGHGLWIARQLCDLLEIRTGQPGTTVRMHIRREP